MDLTLTEEQKEFRQLARDFVNKEVVPHRAAWDRAESVDTAIVEKLADIGFFGMTIPEEYGGLGGDYITYCLGMEELGRADSAVRGHRVGVDGAGGQGHPLARHRGSEARMAAPASRPVRRSPASGSPSRTTVPTRAI